MILRKPYAFLIKYFKIINLVLALLTGYSVYRFISIIKFFNDYVGSNYSGSYYPGFYTQYINLVYLAVILLILIGIGGILLLFINKKKPAKTYIAAEVYFAFYFIFLIYIRSLMITLETTVITAELARIYRDLTVIALIPQFIFIVLFIIRGFGYNLDKFNFKQDLIDLKVEEADNEEFELTFKNDGVKAKRTIRRFFREFKYYIKENMFFVSIISIVVIGILGFIIFKSLPDAISRFGQGDYFESLGLNYKLQDSIITNLDYQGNLIDKNNYYLVIKLFIENKGEKSIEMDFNRFRLVMNKDYIYPQIDKSDKFKDYAKVLNTARIPAESANTYSLIYHLTKDQIQRNYKIKIDGGLKQGKNNYVGKYQYVSINPVSVDNVLVEGTYKIGDTVSFKDSNLGNTSFAINNIEFTKLYNYNYESCTKYGNCETYVDQIKTNYLVNNTTLIIFDYEFNLDSEVPYYNKTYTVNNFINDFVKIRFYDGESYVYAKVSDVTPKKLQKKVALETTNKILDYDNVALSITIRNKEYLINLK